MGRLYRVTSERQWEYAEQGLRMREAVYDYKSYEDNARGLYGCTDEKFNCLPRADIHCQS